ncbi:undecaprenyl diphosphate synthase family protein [Amycolatopsis japonica]
MCLRSSGVRECVVPRHVGIIPDGTRRWSKHNAMDLEEGYKLALTRLTDIVAYLYRKGVEAVSLYLLSSDNLGRNVTDLHAILQAETFMCAELLPPLISDHRVRVTLAGDLSRLPEVFQTPWLTLSSESDGEKRLYLCVGYSPMDEIQASLTAGANTISLEQLWVPERVDLVIRTAGYNRLSNFLPLQSGYAELVFMPVLFNDANITDIAEILARFEETERNYGT